MEKPLFRDILLRLEEITLRKVVVSLWINTLNSNWSLQKNLEDAVDWIKEKVSEMVPTSLKKKMIPLVKLIGLEISNWQANHENYFSDIPDNYNFLSFNHLHWTCMATIDYEKTAERLINLKMFHVTKRFELACLYCLEDYIPLLWEEVSEEYKMHLEEQFYFSIEMQLRYYWAYSLKGEKLKFSCIFKTRLPEDISFYQFAFKFLAVKGNKAGTKYFIQKLSDREIVSSLYYTICSVLNKRYEYESEREDSDLQCRNLSDVLNYLLSLLSPAQQLQALKNLPCSILACFLDWPLSDLFLEVADVIWTFLPETMYPELQNCIHLIIRSSGYYNSNLLREFFQQSPCKFRKEFARRECKFYGDLLPEFFYMQDSQTIEEIFRSLNPAARVRLVFCKRIFKLLCDSIFIGKWHIVEACIREAMLSKKDRQRLKTNFLKFMKKTHRGLLGVEERTRKRKRFCEFLNDPCTIDADKENSKDEILIDVKKLCTEAERNDLPRN